MGDQETPNTVTQPLKCCRCLTRALGRRKRTLSTKAIAELPDAVTITKRGAECAEHAIQTSLWGLGRDA